jgi:hypothetical protein
MHTRTITNIDTGATYEIACNVVACEGGYTWQVLAVKPTAVYATQEEAADGYAVDAQERYERQIAKERGKVARPRCHYCGQEVGRDGLCKECR